MGRPTAHDKYSRTRKRPPERTLLLHDASGFFAFNRHTLHAWLLFHFGERPQQCLPSQLLERRVISDPRHLPPLRYPPRCPSRRCGPSLDPALNRRRDTLRVPRILLYQPNVRVHREILFCHQGVEMVEDKMKVVVVALGDRLLHALLDEPLVAVARLRPHVGDEETRGGLGTAREPPLLGRPYPPTCCTGGRGVSPHTIVSAAASAALSPVKTEDEETSAIIWLCATRLRGAADAE